MQGAERARGWARTGGTGHSAGRFHSPGPGKPVRPGAAELPPLLTNETVLPGRRRASDVKWPEGLPTVQSEWFRYNTQGIGQIDTTAATDGPLGARGRENVWSSAGRQVGWRVQTGQIPPDFCRLSISGVGREPRVSVAWGVNMLFSTHPCKLSPVPRCIPCM